MGLYFRYGDLADRDNLGIRDRLYYAQDTEELFYNIGTGWMELTFPLADHDHDTDYYTQAEIDLLLADKSDEGHDHDADYALVTHNHDADYYTDDEVDLLLAGYLPLTGGTLTDKLAIHGQDAGDIQLTVRGAVGQSTHLSVWEDSSGTDLFWIDKNGVLRGAAGYYIQNGFTGIAGADFTFTGLYDRNELANAGLRGTVTITITGAGSVVGGTGSVNLNTMFDGIAGDFLDISGIDATTTSIVIHIDMLVAQSNYSSVSWRPFVQYRGAMNLTFSHMRNIVVEVSSDNVNWFKPASGAWETTDAVLTEVVGGLWTGAGGNPGISTYRYVRFTLTDLFQNAGYASKDRLWITQLGLRHISAPYARQYARTDGSDIWGNVRVMTNHSNTAYHSLTQSGLGFYGTAPIAQRSAYTQTYSTANKTHDALAAANAMTGITSSSAGTALAEPGATYVQATEQQNFRRIQDRLNELRTDMIDVKQLINSVIDDLQAYGLVG